MLKRKPKKYTFILPLVFTTLFFFLFSLPVFKSIENVTYDWRMEKLQDINIPTGKVALIFIDDYTLKNIGGWPLSRDWYSGLTEILTEMGAKGIIFDILFIDSKAEDKQFAEAIRQSGNVQLSFFLDRLTVKNNVFDIKKVGYPVNELKNSCAAMGFLNCIPDPDGKIRKYLAFVEHEGKFYDSLAIAAIKQFFEGREISRSSKCIEFEMAKKERKLIPLYENNSASVNFYQDLTKFPNFSFIQVFQSYMQMARGETSIIPEDSFKDKVVIIGSVATGASDTGRVSGIYDYPMMGVHASFLENFFQDRFVKKGSGLQNFLFPLVFATASSLLASLSLSAGIISLLGISAIFVIFAVYLFVFKLVLIDIFPAIGAIIFCYISVLILQFVSERKEKQRVRNLFGKYISTAVMEKVLDYKDEISLQGEKKNLTVLFADIRGFTPFSEKNTPEETFSFLNKILSIMTDAVFKYGGTLDKFIGDEVMAIYGAPIDDEKHQFNAVMSAIEMVNNVKAFTSDIKIGIGINTGEMMIGNIGTDRRMEYTAIGDAVNLAARIEGETGGDDIFIGEQTYLSVKNEIPCEHLGRYKIKGKQEEVPLYRVKF
ncbi:MAG TPA: adenylate/guanylate cyclase domain-containing protein [bacterium]|nr:adenylate/guanylate cyclase domain-containing protein [bacterium]